LKIDNVKLLSTLKYVNIWGRGNKIVIGENVWANPDKTTRVWGGSDNSNTTTNYPTNVVVLSADWDYVCGGGRKNIPAGTTVTIGGTANVGTLYGGGVENSTVGTPNGENTDVNIFIEGGTVGTLYGGNIIAIAVFKCGLNYCVAELSRQAGNGLCWMALEISIGLNIMFSKK